MRHRLQIDWIYPNRNCPLQHLKRPSLISLAIHSEVPNSWHHQSIPSSTLKKLSR